MFQHQKHCSEWVHTLKTPIVWWCRWIAIRQIAVWCVVIQVFKQKLGCSYDKYGYISTWNWFCTDQSIPGDWWFVMGISGPCLGVIPRYTQAYGYLVDIVYNDGWWVVGCYTAVDIICRIFQNLPVPSLCCHTCLSISQFTSRCWLAWANVGPKSRDRHLVFVLPWIQD